MKKYILQCISWWFCRFEEQLDDYNIIMVKAIADRLTEVRLELRSMINDANK